MAGGDEQNSEAVVPAMAKGDGSEPDDNTWEVMAVGAAGLVLGLLTSSVVRTAGAVVGGGLLLLQVARVCGYTQVEWRRLQGDVLSSANRRRFHQYVAPRDTQRLAQIWRDVLTSLPTSFLGGFLLGFGLR